MSGRGYWKCLCPLGRSQDLRCCKRTRTTRFLVFLTPISIGPTVWLWKAQATFRNTNPQLMTTLTRLTSTWRRRTSRIWRRFHSENRRSGRMAFLLVPQERLSLKTTWELRQQTSLKTGSKEFTLCLLRCKWGRRKSTSRFQVGSHVKIQSCLRWSWSIFCSTGTI